MMATNTLAGKRLRPGYALVILGAALCLWFHVVAAEAAPAAASAMSSSNLLLNGDFEDADAKGLPENWVTRSLSQGTMAQGALVQKAFSGQRCLMLEGLTFPVMYGAFSRPVDVSNIPGGRLIFSCYYRTEDVPQADVSLTCFNTDFTKNEWKTPPMQSEARPVPQSKDWSLMSWQFDCQPGAKHVVVMFRITGKGKVYFDGAALRPYPAEVSCSFSDVGLITNLPDRRSITCQIANNTDTRRRIRIAALAHVEGNNPQRAEAVADLDPRAKGDITLDYRYDAKLAHQLQIMVLGDSPVDVLDHRSFNVPGAVGGHLTSPAFRNSILSTLPDKDVQAEGFINAVPEVIRAMSFEAHLMGTGQKVTSGGDQFRVSPSGAWRLQFPTAGILSGNFTVRVTARLGNWESSLDLPLRKVEDSAVECGYDMKNRLWVSGRPIFPVGIYYVLDMGELESIAGAGFNFVINPSRTLSYDYAEACTKLGLGFAVSSASLEDSFWRNMKEKFAKSPALLGWYTVERPDAHLTPPRVVRDLHSRLATLSPHHPIMVALSSPSEYSDYLPGVDIPLVWTDVIPTSSISVIGAQMDTAVRAVEGRAPVWAVIQATGRGYAVNKDLDIKTDGRPPTPAEYRAMVYEALIHGANGVVSYAYQIPQDTKRQSYKLSEDAKPLWEAVKSTNTELSWLGPVFANGERKALPAPTPGLDLAMWHTSTGNYLAAVNTSGNAAVTVFNIPGCTASKMDVLFERRRIEGAGNGAFADSFDPYQVHVYYWK